VYKYEAKAILSFQYNRWLKPNGNELKTRRPMAAEFIAVPFMGRKE
jgi:hypothetical protein